MWYPLKNYATCTRFSSTQQNFLAAPTKVVEPTYYHEVVHGPKWWQAMAEEIHALEANNTWIITS